MDNGRCYYHGGRTPKGNSWHKPLLPGRGGSIEKLERKLADLERREKKRAARLRAMSLEDRARYDSWLRAHKPGPEAARLDGRRNRQARADIEAVLAVAAARDATHAASPEAQELARLKARIADLEAASTAFQAAVSGGADRPPVEDGQGDATTPSEARPAAPGTPCKHGPRADGPSDPRARPAAVGEHSRARISTGGQDGRQRPTERSKGEPDR